MTPSEALLPRMDRIQRNSLVVGVVALALSVIGLFLDAAHFWQSYLFAYIFWAGLALGCLGIFFLHNVVGGNWGVAVRRFVESGLQTLPLIALFVIPIFFGMGTLYSWTHADVRAHVHLLQIAMRNAGFWGLRTEWWHFTIANWQKYLPNGATRTAQVSGTQWRGKL